MKHTILQRAAILLGAASIAAAGLIVPATAQATTGNIDPGKDGSAILTVHKYKSDPANKKQGQSNDSGQQLPDSVDLDVPLAGVEFSVTRVTHKSGKQIDLATPAGWDLLADLKALTPAAQVAAVTGGGYTLGTPAKQRTDSAGDAKFHDMSFGLYLVQETSPGNNNVTEPAESFLVTLPLANGSGWNYDVHVYPKNSVGEDISKTVSATDDQAVWRINSPVPALVAGQTAYTKAEISDTLDGRLTYQDGSVKVSFKANGSGALTQLAAVDFAVTLTGRTLQIVLTPSGLAKLSAGSLLVDFTTTVAGNGGITNTAVSNINDSMFAVEDHVAETPIIYYGFLKISKKNKDSPALALQNAQFGVYASAQDANSGASPIAVIATGADGSVSKQLLLGKHDINETVGGSEKTFYAKELAAPAGYVLDSTVHEVIVTQNHSEMEPLTLEITNEKAFLPGLPLTGGQGATLFGVLGGALIVSGAAAAAVRRRRQQVAS